MPERDSYHLLNPEQRNIPSRGPVRLGGTRPMRLAPILAVANPFVGSGTTTTVAHRLGRRAIGFDLAPAYVAMARLPFARQIQSS